MTRRFRCVACGLWLETPIYWRSEVVWRKRANPGALPDQSTIYDVLAPVDGLDLDALANADAGELERIEVPPGSTLHGSMTLEPSTPVNVERVGGRFL